MMEMVINTHHNLDKKVGQIVNTGEILDVTKGMFVPVAMRVLEKVSHVEYIEWAASTDMLKDATPDTNRNFYRVQILD